MSLLPRYLSSYLFFSLQSFSPFACVTSRCDRGHFLSITKLTETTTRAAAATAATAMTLATLNRFRPKTESTSSSANNERYLPTSLSRKDTRPWMYLHAHYLTYTYTCTSHMQYLSHSSYRHTLSWRHHFKNSNTLLITNLVSLMLAFYSLSIYYSHKRSCRCIHLPRSTQHTHPGTWKVGTLLIRFFLLA